MRVHFPRNRIAEVSVTLVEGSTRACIFLESRYVGRCDKSAFPRKYRIVKTNTRAF